MGSAPGRKAGSRGGQILAARTRSITFGDSGTDGGADRFATSWKLRPNLGPATTAARKRSRYRLTRPDRRVLVEQTEKAADRVPPAGSANVARVRRHRSPGRRRALISDPALRASPNMAPTATPLVRPVPGRVRQGDGADAVEVITDVASGHAAGVRSGWWLWSGTTGHSKGMPYTRRARSIRAGVTWAASTTCSAGARRASARSS